MLKNIFYISLAFLIFNGCSTRQSDTQETAIHDHEQSTSLTRWSDDLELFAEFAPIVAGEHADAVIHLTRLDDYKPVTDGNVAVVFSSHDYDEKQFPAESSQPGIFIAHIDIEQTGEYEVRINYSSNQLAASFDIGHMHVSDHAEHDHGAGHQNEETGHDHQEQTLSSASKHITFLKEQQWKTDFNTAPAQERPVASSVMAIAEIVPHQQGYADVVAPVDGLLLVEHNQEMVVPGTSVKKGDQLLVLCPPIGASNTWLDRQLEFERAKRDFERAEKLLERDAMSQREYEQIRQTYMIEKANYETLLQNFSAGEFKAGESCLLLRSPINGVVSDVAVLPGQNIAAGEKLLTVIDPSIVWIQAQLFEKDIVNLGQPTGLFIRLQGSNRLLEFDANQFELLSKGLQIDPDTRTIPVVFKVRNPDNMLRIGQIVQTEIHTAQQQNMVTVPASAVIDEEIEKVVFVQVSGEAFERRTVQTGPAFGDWLSVVSGLEPGERVVTRGAYAVKLAGASVSVGSAHVH